MDDALLGLLSHNLFVLRKKAYEKVAAIASEARQNPSGDAFKRAIALRKDCLDLHPHHTWELRQSSFLACKELLKVSAGEVDDTFFDDLLHTCMEHLEDPEARVRLSVAEALESLAKHGGVSVWLRVREWIMDIITENFDRAEEAASSPDQDTPEASPRQERRRSSCVVPLSEHQIRLHDKLQGLKHDTEGWKSLETAFVTLHRLIRGCGKAFEPHVTPELLQLLFRSVKHTNRFVREAAFFACGTIASICPQDKLHEMSQQLANIIAKGLADNWSQVRFASSVAARQFMLASEGFRAEFYGVLIPPMCLNRYYVAAGVRNYSHETWKMVVGSEGKDIVANFAEPVCAYYVSQTEADNHAVREAACHCIAELATKIDRPSMSAHVNMLLPALIDCFKDESWPVRDAACIALGDFVLAFPEECRSRLEELYGMWVAHLSDNIPSVREDSAMALGQVMKAYKEESLEKMLPTLRELLPRVKEQPAESTKYGELENTTLFGVAAKKKRDNDPHLHQDQQVYSCGSLAPKLKRGAGCMDHGFSRAKEVWEETDGAVFLLRELSSVFPDKVVEFMPVLAEVATVRSFAHYTSLQETVWKSLPIIAKNMGKTAFKRHMEIFLPPLFETLDCGNRLAMNQAGLCIGVLARWMVVSIFKARLEPWQVQAMETSPFVDRL